MLKITETVQVSFISRFDTHFTAEGGAAGREGRADARVPFGFLMLESVHKQDTEPQSAPEGI